MSRSWRGLAAIALLAWLVPAPLRACTGLNCMNVYASADGGGALLVQWDFATRPVQTFQSLCTAGRCLYSSIDPGFLAGEPPAPEGAFVVANGIVVALEMVAIDDGLTLRINGTPLRAAGDRATLGTIPSLHNHPSWQLNLPEGVRGTYEVAFRITTVSSLYDDSPVYTALVTNLEPTPQGSSTPSATPTPTPTATPRVAACAGDCDGDGQVTIAELIQGVNAALGGTVPCAAFDTTGDGTVSIAELVAAVSAALGGCPSAPTPTPTEPATFAAIQQTILSPRCAVPFCHDSAVASGNLNLEPAQAYDALVGVAPDVEAARAAGLLRVDAGDPDNSFLLVKLAGPPPGQGSRMPLGAPPLGEADMDLVRAWIAAGAAP